jgi:hypothetical protein
MRAACQEPGAGRLDRALQTRSDRSACNNSVCCRTRAVCLVQYTNHDTIHSHCLSNSPGSLAAPAILGQSPTRPLVALALLAGPPMAQRMSCLLAQQPPVQCGRLVHLSLARMTRPCLVAARYMAAQQPCSGCTTDKSHCPRRLARTHTQGWRPACSGPAAQMLARSLLYTPPTWLF